MKKEMKTFSVLLISVLFVSLFTVMVAAADPPAGETGTGEFGRAIESIVNGIKEGGDPFFKALLGSSRSGQEWVVQVLAFLLVVFVVYGVLSTVGIFGGNPWINFIIGVIVAILGVRFLPADILQLAVTPSSAFVAVLVMGLPLVLLFFITKDLPSVARKAVWIAYGVLVLILWVIAIGKPGISSMAKAVYPLIVIVCIVLFIFDGTLTRLWGKAKGQKGIEVATNINRSKIIADIKDLQNRMATATTGAERNDIAGQIKDLKDALNKL